MILMFARSCYGGFFNPFLCCVLNSTGYLKIISFGITCRECCSFFVSSVLKKSDTFEMGNWARSSAEKEQNVLCMCTLLVMYVNSFGV